LQAQGHDTLCNIDHWDVLQEIGKITSFRKGLKKEYSLQDLNKLRNVIFLDLNLEDNLRRLVEKLLQYDIGFENYKKEIQHLLDNLCETYAWHELHIVRRLFAQKVLQNGMSNREEAREAKAVVDRVKSCLGEAIDEFQEVFSEKSLLLGKKFKAADYTVNLFVEEQIRGSLFFALSMVCKKIEREVRSRAQLGDWLLISRGLGEARGKLVYSKSLLEVMDKKFGEQTVLFVDKITGEEEVPENVSAIILNCPTDFPDVLAHVSVRARNLKVILSVYFNEAECRRIKDTLMGQFLHLKAQGADLKVSPAQQSDTDQQHSADHIAQIKKNAIEGYRPPELATKFFLLLEDFQPRIVGAKSLNIKIMREKIPAWIKLPESACVPFHAMEKVFELNPDKKTEAEQVPQDPAKPRKHPLQKS